LLVDDVPVGQQTVDVPTAEESSVRFSYRFSTPGDHTIAVRSTPDRLQPDDTRWLVVRVRKEIRVLCVAGGDGAAKYVADALNPNPDMPSAIRPTIVSDGQLAELELADFESVFLCNVARLTAAEAERLTRYVATGGGVVIFLGDRVVPSSYNAFAPTDSDPSQPSELQLLPARIGDQVSPNRFGIDPLDYRHAVVAPFRGRERAGLLTTPISRYFRLDLSESPRCAQVAAAMPSGDPLIVTVPMGRGRMALVATDGSLSSMDATTGEPWTLWPTWPSFLPIVRELLTYVSGGVESSQEQLVGSSLYGLLPNSESSVAKGQELRVMLPGGRMSAISVQPTAEGLAWTFDGTELSGIYLLHGLPNTNVKPFAVNVDSTESDLARLDTKDLPPEIVIRTVTGSGVDGDGNDTQFSRAGWSGALLAAALAIMFIESFLAWQFGRGGA
jgi:hypothetical protein